MSGQFSGKTVMITGAAGAVGSAVVRKFAGEGANLVLVDLHREGAEKLAQDLGLSSVLILAADMGQPDAADDAVTQAEARFGAIHALAHIAGGFAMGDPVHAGNIDVFERMIYLNARLTYVACGRVARSMVEKEVAGSIVAVLARSGLKGGKNMAAYTASKAAAQRIIESMAQELMPHNIRVNGIMPSTVDTPANRRDMPNADFSKWVSPTQLAEAIAFLSSDAASAITGESLGVYHKA